MQETCAVLPRPPLLAQLRAAPPDCKLPCPTGCRTAAVLDPDYGFASASLHYFEPLVTFLQVGEGG